jgi:hypothetical protein
VNKTRHTPDGFTPPRRLQCPDWCSGHDIDELSLVKTEGRVVHSATVGGDVLDELRNPFSGVVHRADWASYDVTISTQQDADETYNHPEFIGLQVGRWRAEHERAEVELRLTSGEARSMAAVLVAAADRLPEGDLIIGLGS